MQQFGTDEVYARLFYDGMNYVAYSILGQLFQIFRVKFYFLPYNCAFVTHITPFSKTFTKMSQLGDFKHAFTSV
jgi:hypothetical protein